MLDPLFYGFFAIVVVALVIATAMLVAMSRHSKSREDETLNINLRDYSIYLHPKKKDDVTLK